MVGPPAHLFPWSLVIVLSYYGLFVWISNAAPHPFGRNRCRNLRPYALIYASDFALVVIGFA